MFLTEAIAAVYARSISAYYDALPTDASVASSPKVNLEQQ